MTSTPIYVPSGWRQCSTHPLMIVNRKGDMIANVADETLSGVRILHADRHARFLANATRLYEACCMACDFLESFDFKMAKEELESAINEAWPVADAPLASQA